MAPSGVCSCNEPYVGASCAELAYHVNQNIYPQFVGLEQPDYDPMNGL